MCSDGLPTAGWWIFAVVSLLHGKLPGQLLLASIKCGQLKARCDLLCAEMEPMQAPKRASTRSARIAAVSPRSSNPQPAAPKQ